MNNNMFILLTKKQFIRTLSLTNHSVRKVHNILDNLYQETLYTVRLERGRNCGNMCVHIVQRNKVDKIYIRTFRTISIDPNYTPLLFIQDKTNGAIDISFMSIDRVYTFRIQKTIIITMPVVSAD